MTKNAEIVIAERVSWSCCHDTDSSQEPMVFCSSLNSGKNGNLIVVVRIFSCKGSVYHPFSLEWASVLVQVILIWSQVASFTCICEVLKDKLWPGRTASFNKKMNTTLSLETIVSNTHPYFNSLVPVLVPVPESVFSYAPNDLPALL